MHLKRLEELEYLLIHRGGRGQQLVYELLYHGQGQDGSLFFPGLLDVESLRRGAQDTANTPPSTPGSDQPNTLNTGYDEPRSGETATQSGASRGQVGGKSGGCRPGVGGQKTLESTDIPSDSAA